ncbi:MULTISPECIES: hypothetical protein [unclassified Microbacterium]|nr:MULTISPECIES: hypothetical protein [unclassified Microbacterium]MCR2786101.1 hypothetical protein [Microbacterium sp. zg.B96]WIM17050.1 hypothetical protein QNO11_05285 [Microbacterium sp. zg-B96]
MTVGVKFQHERALRALDVQVLDRLTCAEKRVTIQVLASLY